MGNKKRRIAPYRISQIISAVLLNVYVLAYIQNKILYTGFFKHIPQPVLNCYGGPLAVFACPIGSFQQMIGIHQVPWLVIGIFVVIGAFVGRTACAWMCPFGLWQDLLAKIKVGPKAETKRWISFGVIAGITAVASVLLVIFVNIDWWKVLLFGWLPFTALALFVAVKGKMDVPKRMWLGGLLASVGLGILVWARFGESFGVVAGVLGMVILSLTGRWFAATAAAVAGFLISVLGSGFCIGPLSGAVLGLVVAIVGFGLVVLLDRVAKASLPSTYLKFWFLILVVVVVAYKTGQPWFCQLCPAGTLGAGIPLVLWDPVNALQGLVGWLFWVKVAILLVLLVAAIAVKRPFCRLICPIGAIYSVFNKASLLRMEFDEDTCTHCRICRKVCPMNIEPCENPNQLECIRCFECVWNCPKKSLRIRV